MRNLCIFVTYSNNSSTSQNVIDLITELCNSFKEVIIASNYILDEKYLSVFKNYKIIIYKNEGYDFGMIYKTLRTINTNNYDRIAFINDSIFILKPFRDFFVRKIDCDMWGMTDSYESLEFKNFKYYTNKIKKILFNKNHLTDLDTIKKSYHIQSYFLVFESNAIPLIKDFFESINFEQILKIKNIRLLKKTIIIKCEIGISQYMLNNGMKLDAIFKVNDISKIKYSNINTTVSMWRELIKKGFPFLKKHIIRKRRNS